MTKIGGIMLVKKNCYFWADGHTEKEWLTYSFALLKYYIILWTRGENSQT